MFSQHLHCFILSGKELYIFVKHALLCIPSLSQYLSRLSLALASYYFDSVS